MRSKQGYALQNHRIMMATLTVQFTNNAQGPVREEEHDWGTAADTPECSKYLRHIKQAARLCRTVRIPKSCGIPSLLDIPHGDSSPSTLQLQNFFPRAATISSNEPVLS